MIQQHKTTLGTIWSQWTQHGLYRVQWNHPGDARIDAAATASTALDRQIESFDRQLAAFCDSGQGTFADVRIDSTLWTDFTARVYACCRQIPAGQTWTYKQLAARAGNDRASRAVGAAMSRNRILLVIPCHRVIASNGQLRGFSAPGGLETKQALLDLERTCNSQQGQRELIFCKS
ncbi:MAG: MGMT family protein [Pirellulaceae bacterium]|nr:MGMT family protein [Pirellulaceae bacterium]